MSEKKTQTEELNSVQEEKGFSNKKRKILMISCALVVAVVLFIFLLPVFTYIFRPRELTIENYQKYVKVEVVDCTNANSTGAEYEIRVSRKENSYDIANFAMTVEVTFELTGENPPVQGYEQEITYQLSISDFFVKENETIVKTVTLPHLSYDDKNVLVVSVAGDM